MNIVQWCSIVLVLSMGMGCSVVTAAPGCITDREGTRQTAYHYVACACPCGQYPRYPKRHVCAGCGHLGIDPQLPLLRSGWCAER